ncbi:hypothetical protein F2Q69_00003274 [Brassica cretica]|uniref:Uncharacterized protein n=1 Tax=Brassica cretica TaxID=69181 RepID=A0A8S9NYB9_BRACR|nr:hypothetical protein F2Q69_00003274 [Brassica cretica]
MDSSCWTCVSLNKNRRWRWREDGIWLAGLKSLSSWIGGCISGTDGFGATGASGAGVTEADGLLPSAGVSSGLILNS